MRSHVQVWPYRYGPNGVQPLKRSQLGDGCPSYGPDGVNVVYERENYGANAGQWVKRYLTTDYQGTVLQAHDVNGDHVQHYELFGAEKGQVARRTGWLDREIDWESSPLTDLYRTVDLVNRKYDPQRGVFLTSDPLWMMSADASSYHFAYHDPMNMIDPWGLNGEVTNSGNPSAGGDDVGSGGGVDVGPSNKDEQQDPSINWADVFAQDLMRDVYLRGVGVGALPGVGIGGGGLGPVGGSNGGTGKTDVAPSSSKTGTGENDAAGLGKTSQLYRIGEADKSHVSAYDGGVSLKQGPTSRVLNYDAYKYMDWGGGTGVGILPVTRALTYAPNPIVYESRRYPVDSHHDEHNDGARKKPGNNGKMGKNVNQNKQFDDALNEALRAEGIRKEQIASKFDQLHDHLSGKTDNYRKLVLLIREWLQSNVAKR